MPNLEYSFDPASDIWYTCATGEIVQFENEVIYLRGDNQSGWSKSSLNYSTIKIHGDVAVSGNIMGLLDNGNYIMSSIPCDYCFYKLFESSDGIVDSSKKILSRATVLTNSCYRSMFNNCINLSFSPNILATTLAENCYRYMYADCYNLKSLPHKIDAEQMAPSCCKQMFVNCVSLLEVTKNMLVYNILAEYCYNLMFEGCISLTIAPELPATTLAYGCYQNMFQGCTSLTAAPELPAETLASSCYSNMFSDCTSLNSIKIGYTGYYDSAYFNGWVTGVSASGAFYYNGDQTAQDFKLPNGWTTEQF